MIVLVDNIEELAELLACFVRQGVTFKAAKVGAGGRWEVILTGGY
jgi:hypothetical protein